MSICGTDTRAPAATTLSATSGKIPLWGLWLFVLKKEFTIPPDYLKKIGAVWCAHEHR